MDEENFGEMVTKQLKNMESKIADIVSEIAYNCCLECDDKGECWSNPIEGVAKTISPIIKAIDEGKSRITSQATSKLLLLIRKKKMEKGK